MAVPTKIELGRENQLFIDWDDGQRRRYSVKQLRDECPCATCREKRSQPAEPSMSLLPILSAAEAQPLRLVGMKPLGNYAYALAFSDGHNTGIYTLERLREMGEEVTAGTS